MFLSYVNDKNKDDNNIKDILGWVTIAYIVLCILLILFLFFVLGYSDEAILTAYYWGRKDDAKKAFIKSLKLFGRLILVFSMVSMYIGNYAYIKFNIADEADNVYVIYNSVIIGISSIILLVGLGQRVIKKPSAKEYKSDPVLRMITNK